MTVKELIETLQGFDPDMDVMYYDEYRYVHIDKVEVTSDTFYDFDFKEVENKTFVGII